LNESDLEILKTNNESIAPNYSNYSTNYSFHGSEYQRTFVRILSHGSCS